MAEVKAPAPAASLSELEEEAARKIANPVLENKQLALMMEKAKITYSQHAQRFQNFLTSTAVEAALREVMAEVLQAQPDPSTVYQYIANRLRQIAQTARPGPAQPTTAEIRASMTPAQPLSPVSPTAVAALAQSSLTTPPASPPAPAESKASLPRATSVSPTPGGSRATSVSPTPGESKDRERRHRSRGDSSRTSSTSPHGDRHRERDGERKHRSHHSSSRHKSSDQKPPNDRTPSNTSQSSAYQQAGQVLPRAPSKSPERLPSSTSSREASRSPERKGGDLGAAVFSESRRQLTSSGSSSNVTITSQGPVDTNALKQKWTSAPKS